MRNFENFVYNDHNQIDDHYTSNNLFTVDIKSVVNNTIELLNNLVAK